MSTPFFGDHSPETARFTYEQACWIVDHTPAIVTPAEQKMVTRCQEIIAAYQQRFPTEAEKVARETRRKLEDLEEARAGAEYVIRHSLDYLQQKELHEIERNNMISWMKRWLVTYGNKETRIV